MFTERNRYELLRNVDRYQKFWKLSSVLRILSEASRNSLKILEIFFFKLDNFTIIGFRTRRRLNDSQLLPSSIFMISRENLCITSSYNSANLTGIRLASRSASVLCVCGVNVACMSRDTKAKRERVNKWG